MALNPIWKLAPYFVVKWLGKKYCERVPHQGLVVEVFEKGGIAILEGDDNANKVRTSNQ